MCPVTIGTALGATAASAAAVGTGVIIAGVTTAATIGMGIYSNVQAQNQANAQRSFQAASQQQQIRSQQHQQFQTQQNQDAQQAIALQQQQEAQALQQAAQQQQLDLQRKQGQDAVNLQMMQANAAMDMEYQIARQKTLTERAVTMARNENQRLTYQKTLEAAKQQVTNNNEAANRVYVAEQEKINQARKEAAFATQEQLANAIGAKGSILATGRTGVSVGLLVKDVERQEGFALAQEMAMLDNKRTQAIIGMDSGWIQAQGANNTTMANVPLFPADPYLPDLPDKPQYINPIGLGIDSPYAA